MENTKLLKGISWGVATDEEGPVLFITFEDEDFSLNCVTIHVPPAALEQVIDEFRRRNTVYH